MTQGSAGSDPNAAESRSSAAQAGAASPPSIVAPGGRDRATLRSGKAWLVLVVAMLIGLGADLWTKYWAFRTVAGFPVHVDRDQAARTARPSLLIPYHEPVEVIPHVLDFTLVLNPGAVFGMGAGKRWFFVTLTGVALLMGIWLFAVWTRPRQWWAHVAIGLVLAGGLGNLYDRVVYACVRDFIHPLPGVNYPFGWSSPWSGREVWPWVSNVADKLLIIGIAILIWHILIGWKKRA